VWHLFRLYPIIKAYEYFWKESFVLNEPVPTGPSTSVRSFPRQVARPIHFCNSINVLCPISSSPCYFCFILHILPLEVEWSGGEPEEGSRSCGAVRLWSPTGSQTVFGVLVRTHSNNPAAHKLSTTLVFCWSGPLVGSRLRTPVTLELAALTQAL
jgi:hypothetical protein